MGVLCYCSDMLFVNILLILIFSWNGSNDINVAITTKSTMAKNRVIEKELPLD